LLSGQNLDESAAEAVEHIRASNMAMQADGIELCEHVHSIQTAIDAIRERDIDQPIFSRQRDGRLGTIFRQRIQACSTTAAEN